MAWLIAQVLLHLLPEAGLKCTLTNNSLSFLGLYIFNGSTFLPLLGFNLRPYKEGLVNGTSQLFQPWWTLSWMTLWVNTCNSFQIVERPTSGVTCTLLVFTFSEAEFESLYPLNCRFTNLSAPTCIQTYILSSRTQSPMACGWQP